MPNPNFLSPQEFADALGLDVETIRRRIRKRTSENHFVDPDRNVVNVGTGKRPQWRIHRDELPAAIGADWTRAA